MRDGRTADCKILGVIGVVGHPNRRRVHPCRMRRGVFDRVIGDGGGDNNASTHPDFTSHVERAPLSALAPLLWLEADRMKTLAFDQESLDNQRDVVKEEIRVNVLNQPFGGFATTDLPQLAFSRWENGRDGYGSFDDLDRASVARFSRSRPTPGPSDPCDRRWIERAAGSARTAGQAVAALAGIVTAMNCDKVEARVEENGHG
mgnify:CR=1 FL=1